jgi:hypothetical protein
LQLQQTLERYPGIEVVYLDEKDCSVWPKPPDIDQVWFDEVTDIPEQEYLKMGSNQRVGGVAMKILAAGAGELPSLRRPHNYNARGLRLSSNRTFKGTTGTYWEPSRVGAKERKKAKRFYMEPNFPNGTPRSKPVMLQLNHRDQTEVEFVMHGLRVFEASKGYAPIEHEKAKWMAVHHIRSGNTTPEVMDF